MDFKYTLIVSQYYHSRHSFIVKFNAKTFIEQSKKFVAELEKLKRQPDNDRDIDYGDLTYRKTDEIYSRYNINDSGDIYFFNSRYANILKGEACSQQTESIRNSKGYIKVAIQERVREHHSDYMIRAIVEKYFEIA